MNRYDDHTERDIEGLVEEIDRLTTEGDRLLDINDTLVNQLAAAEARNAELVALDGAAIRQAADHMFEIRRLEALNAELLAALKVARRFNVITVGREQIDAATAKAGGRE